MNYEIKIGDSLEVLKTMDDESVQCCVTSPPYWALRNYDMDGQLGQEATPEEYVDKLVEIMGEVHRVLRSDGTLWLNLGDSYVGSGNKGKHKDGACPNHRNGQVVAKNNKVKGLKPKDMVGIPWRVAFALQEFGWWLRSDIIWHKPNPMPIPVKDRPTTCHEHIFLLSKSQHYYYDKDAILEPLKDPKRKDPPTSAGFGGNKHTNNKDKTLNNAYSGTPYDATKLKGKNKRDVWTVATNGYKGAHFAVYPPKLIEPCILAGCPDGGVVLDPFSGSGTTGVVALNNNKKYIGIELNPEFADLSHQRIKDQVPNTLVEHMSE